MAVLGKGFPDRQPAPIMEADRPHELFPYFISVHIVNGTLPVVIRPVGECHQLRRFDRTADNTPTVSYNAVPVGRAVDIFFGQHPQFRCGKARGRLTTPYGSAHRNRFSHKPFSSCLSFKCAFVSRIGSNTAPASRAASSITRNTTFDQSLKVGRLITRAAPLRFCSVP